MRNVAQIIAASLLETDDFDPMAEIERMEVPPILAELGFAPMKNRKKDGYARWFKLLDARNKLVAVIPKSITAQSNEMCWVALCLLERPKQWMVQSDQKVSVHDLPVLLKNYLRWFKDSQSS